MPDVELMPIAIEYLEVGSVATDDIYVKFRMPLLMVRRGSIISAKMLDSLYRSTSGGRNVYVKPSYYYELLSHGLPKTLSQMHLESSIGYDIAKNETNNLLTYLKENKTVHAKQSEAISNDLSKKISTAQAATIIQCINGKNNVDEYLCTHSTNVALLNGLMGKWLELPQKEIDILITCGLLHDVGKSEVPSEILDAPRKLTDEEFEIMRMHSVYSYEMLSRNPDIDPLVATIARSHHEKMNGNGYPDGLIGEHIPLYARITAISDVYDAMVSSRCYKAAHSPFIVLYELSVGKFSDLDFELIELFLKMMPNELIGRPVLLSDGTVAKVKFIDHKKLKHPIVERDNEVIATSDELYCESLIV